MDTNHEPRLITRHMHVDEDPHSPTAIASSLPPATPQPRPIPAWRTRRRLVQATLVFLVLLVLLAPIAWFSARLWVRSTARAALPQLDGSLTVPGLAAPVTVQRDEHGVPHIRAASIDDLIFAQAFITTGDRLFQMDLLRRHAAGELAAILGPSLLPHDRLQRTLQIRAAADRAITQLPPDQLHTLEVYARGVNAAITQQRGHLPLEFHLLGYKPAPWTPRDSILVSLAMFQDLTNQYQTKLAREALSARLPAELVPDLYPTGSWRDHPPTTPEPDLTIQGPPIEQVPLDESQSGPIESARTKPLDLVPHNPGAPGLAPETWVSSLAPETWVSRLAQLSGAPSDPSLNICQDCTAGSNNWVVSGAHTASGKPLLSNDMHLNHTLPGIWYEADLATTGSAAADLHVSGVSIPGLPLIVVGHNQHIAWGFTNLGADVQDLYLESLRGSGADQEFQAADGSWQPVTHLTEHIQVKHGSNETLDILATRHGQTLTPILTPTIKGETRPIALRWTLYDPAVLELPTLLIAQAHDWPSFLAAMSHFGGPAQNVVYADDQGHIGYHALGRIPLRGPGSAFPAALDPTLASPAQAQDPDLTPAISKTPNPLARTDIAAPSAPTTPQLSGPLSPIPLIPSPDHEWSGYIPFDQLPQAYDPLGGVIATANARVAPDDFPYPITLNWAAPYRNERIWHVLAGRKGLVPADMLALQTDVYSDFDHVLAQRLAYALDHSPTLASGAYKSGRAQSLRQAADLLRNWNGRMATDSPAAALASAVHTALWPMLLRAHLEGPLPPDPGSLYVWGERDYALEQLLQHQPPRWLPAGTANWDDFLTDAVDHALVDSRAPADLATWRYGTAHTVDIEAPIYEQSQALRMLLGRPTGTGPQPQSGDSTTVKQVGHTFGPSERLTVSLADPDASTLNLVAGQSGNPLSPWFLDQFPAWLKGTTFISPFTDPAVSAAATHTLTLKP